MTYTKPGWKPVTTELNDSWKPWDHPDADPIGDILRMRDRIKGDYDRMLHRDWCDDGTCWCHRS